MFVLCVLLLACAPESVDQYQPSAESVRALLEQLKSPRMLDRQEAWAALNRLGPNNAELVPLFIEALQEKSQPKQYSAKIVAAYKILPRIGKPAVPALIRLLRADEDTVDRVYVVLGKMGREKMGDEGKPVLVALMERAKRGDTRAFGIIASFGRDAAPAIPCIVAQLDNPDEKNLGAAFFLTAWLGQIGKDSVPALMRFAQSPHACYRQGAITALGNIGADAAPAVPLLLEARMDLDFSVRGHAAAAIVKVGPKSVPYLVKALGSQDAFLRAEAIHFLDCFGASSMAAAPALERLTKDEDPFVRVRARLLLKRLAPIQ